MTTRNFTSGKPYELWEYCVGNVTRFIFLYNVRSKHIVRKEFSSKCAQERKEDFM